MSIERALELVGGRLRRKRALTTAVLGGALATSLGAALALSQVLGQDPAGWLAAQGIALPLLGACLVPTALGALLGFFWGLRTRVPAPVAAAVLEHEGRRGAVFSTLLELEANAHPWAVQVRREAEAALNGLDPRRTVPFGWPWATRWLVGATLFTVFLLMLPPLPARTVRAEEVREVAALDADQLEQVKRTGSRLLRASDRHGASTLREASRELVKLADDVERQRLSRLAALSQLGDVEADLKEERRRIEARARWNEELARSPDLAEVLTVDPRDLPANSAERRTLGEALRRAAEAAAGEQELERALSDAADAVDGTDEAGTARAFEALRRAVADLPPESWDQFTDRESEAALEELETIRQALARGIEGEPAEAPAEPGSEPGAETPTEPGAEAPTTEPGAEPPTTEPGAEPPTEPGAEAPTTEPGAEAPTTEPGAEAPTPEPGAEPPTTEPGAEPPTTEPGAEPPTTEPGAEAPTPEPGAEAPTPEPGAETPTTEPGAETTPEPGAETPPEPGAETPPEPGAEPPTPEPGAEPPEPAAEPPADSEPEGEPTQPEDESEQPAGAMPELPPMMLEMAKKLIENLDAETLKDMVESMKPDPEDPGGEQPPQPPEIPEGVEDLIKDLDPEQLKKLGKVFEDIAKDQAEGKDAPKPDQLPQDLLDRIKDMDPEVLEKLKNAMPEPRGGEGKPAGEPRTGPGPEPQAGPEAGPQGAQPQADGEPEAGPQGAQPQADGESPPQARPLGVAGGPQAGPKGQPQAGPKGQPQAGPKGQPQAGSEGEGAPPEGKPSTTETASGPPSDASPTTTPPREREIVLPAGAGVETDEDAPRRAVRSRVPFSEVPPAVLEEATRALDRQRVPATYERVVREYFRRFRKP